MIINIITTHRFHLLDLARELSNQGYDVKFYSYVPSKRCISFGVDKKQCVNFLWLVWPFFLLARLFPNNKKWQFDILMYRNRLIDWYISKTMRKCDILIALGCVYIRSIQKAKQEWNAVTILEWGSKHIIEQLKQFGKLDTYPQEQLESDLNEYNLVDYISIAATHVKKSFLIHGIDERKLLVNPYGVNLSEFRPTIYSGEYDIISVGGWRFEKGSDLLVEVCKRYGYKLLHVGAIVNMRFPSESNFTHHEPVNQKYLINFYSKAKIFALPSRAEGLSLVQAQAIACGLPVVCSKETGGIDLAKNINSDSYIIEMESLDVESLNIAIQKALHIAAHQIGKRDYAGDSIHNLSWAAYGVRYSNYLKEIIQNENKRYSY